MKWIWKLEDEAAIMIQKYYRSKYRIFPDPTRKRANRLKNKLSISCQ